MEGAMLPCRKGWGFNHSYTIRGCKRVSACQTDETLRDWLRWSLWAEFKTPEIRNYNY